MKRLQQVRTLLDEINTAIERYDPVLKDRARDILLQVAFGNEFSQLTSATPAAAAGEHSPMPEAVSQSTGAAHRSELHLDFSAAWRRWAPPRASEKALLAAFFLQEVRGHSPMSSQHINTVLKQHGLSVSNITRAVETNLNAEPPLMEQLRKLGTTRQARKQYRVTSEGSTYVRQKLGFYQQSSS